MVVHLNSPSHPQPFDVTSSADNTKESMGNEKVEEMDQTVIDDFDQNMNEDVKDMTTTVSEVR